MALGPSQRPPIALPDITVGIFIQSIALSAAYVVALGISRLDTHQLRLGLTYLFIAVGARTLAHFAQQLWTVRRGRATRLKWRATVPDQLWRGAHVTQWRTGSLLEAIERVSFLPTLGVLVGAVLTSLGGLIVLWINGGIWSLGITLALMAAAVPLYIKAGRQSEVSAARYRTIRQQLEHRQLEVLANITELRGVGALGFAGHEIAALSNEEHTVALGAIRVALRSSLITEFLSGVTIGLVAMIVGFGLLHGVTTLRPALAAVLLCAEIVGSLRRVGLEFHRVDDARDALNLLTASSKTPATHSSNLFDVTNVTTSATARPVSFVVEPGERLVVRGHSGAGKTTLLDTLIGWREPLAGTIERSDVPIGYVAPNQVILGGSLQEALGNDTQHAINLLERLGLSDVTEIGPNGSNVSSGQLIRLLIARALVHDAQVLILDDIAGLLDVDSRNNIERVLEEYPHIAVIEAASGEALTRHPTREVQMGS